MHLNWLESKTLEQFFTSGPIFCPSSQHFLCFGLWTEWKGFREIMEFLEWNQAHWTRALAAVPVSKWHHTSTSHTELVKRKGFYKLRLTVPQSQQKELEWEEITSARHCQSTCVHNPSLNVVQLHQVALEMIRARPHTLAWCIQVSLLPQHL